MIISVVGNLCAGKSTLVKELSKALPSYKVMAIDDYRRKFSDEKKATESFISDVSLARNGIVESTGTGKYYQRAIRVHADNLYTVKVDEGLPTCLRRWEDRLKSGYHLPPYPHHFEPADSMKHLAQRIAEIPADRVVRASDDWKQVSQQIAELVERQGTVTQVLKPQLSRSVRRTK